MSLIDWVEHKWLTEEPTSKEEIADLLKAADLSLNERRFHTSSLDWKFNIAYAAIIGYANVALRASGYRTRVGSHHYYVIQSLAHTLKLDSKLIGLIDSFRRISHIGTYERAGIVSEKDADEIYEIAIKLRETLFKWLMDNYPELI
jgi:hypothetical protein